MELQFKGICEVQSSSSRDSARVCAALALVLFSSYILNTFLFPPIAGVFPVAREITTYGGVVFSVVVAMVAQAVGNERDDLDDCGVRRRRCFGEHAFMGHGISE